jgi:hypothetical protein
MLVEFFDRQDRANSLNGVKILTGAELSDIVDHLSHRPPFFCELIGANGCKLLIGIAKAVGCVQYSTSDGSPPYLMALSDRALDNHTFVEFLIGNTPTPVPARYCVPFDTVKRVAAWFVETGLRDSRICWEPVAPRNAGD